MLKPWWVVSIAALGLAQGAGTVSGQDYPNRPIRIVTSPPGGGNDFISRLIAQGISGPLGQNVIVENRPTSITGEIVASAPPDGYTLLQAGTTFLIAPLLQKTPYDVVKDFSPITLVSAEPSVLVVHASVAVNSVKELIELAKAKPGVLNYASTGSGGSAHIAAELFKSMAGVNIVRIPYKGSGPAVNDLVGGQVQLMFGTAASVAPHVKSGRLRSLAVTSVQMSALAPGVPTVAASLPGYDAASIVGIFAPAQTPMVIVRRLNEQIGRVLALSDTKQKFLSAGIEAVSSTPEEFAARIKSSMTRVGKVIKDAGIRAD